MKKQYDYVIFCRVINGLNRVIGSKNISTASYPRLNICIVSYDINSTIQKYITTKIKSYNDEFKHQNKAMIVFYLVSYIIMHRANIEFNACLMEF